MYKLFLSILLNIPALIILGCTLYEPFKEALASRDRFEELVDCTCEALKYLLFWAIGVGLCRCAMG